MNPTIRIKNGWLLQSMLIDRLIAQIPDKKHLLDSADPGTFRDKVIDRQELWKKCGEQILDGMRKITGLEFNAKVIEVYLVEHFDKAFSDPLVVGIYYEGDRFIDTLTHEILHNLLTDNNEHIDAGMWVRRQFPDIKQHSTIHHIMVHAVHEAIYRDVLKNPTRLQADIDMCKNLPDYKRSWDVVRGSGYKNLIREFRLANNLD